MTPIASPTPLLADLRQLIDAARQRVASTVNAELTQLYWQIGRRINAELLQGQRAEYGKQIVADLAQQLTTEFGKGWSERQLRYCLRVADTFPDAQILHTLCSQLSWSHLRLIIQIDDPIKRDFYIEICRVERWSVRQLQKTQAQRQPMNTQPKVALITGQDGSYRAEFLLEKGYIVHCIKRRASLSLQKHHHRAEHWIVVKGTAEVTCGDKKLLLGENQSTYIPLGEVHRLTNPGKVPLEIIEVQSGSYLGEDDIVRFEDNYGRGQLG